MDISPHSINTLFEQLGLPASDSEIDTFLNNHSLAANTRLIDAEFWTESQSAFLNEALEDDADWTEIVDQLAARLRH